MKNYLVVHFMWMLSLAGFCLEAQELPDHLSPEYKQMVAQGLIPPPPVTPAPTSFPSNSAFLKTYTVCQPVEQGCIIPVDFDTWERTTFEDFEGNNGWNCDDCSSAFIPFEFEYSVCGTPYTGCYVNINGNLTFDIPFEIFTPEGIPNNLAVMVAPYWSDVDLGLCGEIWMELTSTHLIVAWLDVGYYNEECDKLATFEVVITDGNDPIIGIGNNTAFYYCDVDFTTGAASGGIDGFGGSPATVGINANNDNSFAIIGRFDHPGTDYDGPLGDSDGCDFLDNKFYLFSAEDCEIESSCSIFDLEINPLVCDGNSYDLEVSFIPAGVGPNAFFVNLGSDSYGPYFYGSQGSVTTAIIPDLPGNGQVGIPVYVFDLDNDGCGTDCIYDAPSCVPVCEISDLTLAVGPCNGTSFPLTVNFNYLATSEGFTLSVGNASYGSYAYNELPITLPMPGDEQQNIPVTVNDIEIAGCGITENFDAPRCEIPCVINNLQVTTSACSGTQYVATIDFIHLDTGTSFHLSIGGTDYGLHSYADLPLSYTFSGNATQNISVSISDDAIAGCTATTLFNAPLCCGSYAGVMSGAQYVCAGSTASAQTSGQVLQPGDLLIYALHTAAGNEPGEVLSTNASGIISMGNAMYNTMYYISAIVGPSNGQGGVDITNPCTSVAPGAPVVFLTPVHILINEVCDWDISGDFSITVGADGGLPDYLPGAVYTVSGSNLNPVTLGADQSALVMLGQFDGQSYSYSVADSQGCNDARTQTVICYKTPIELISFEGKIEADGNLLHWTTGSEADNDYFTIERSLDQINFDRIKTIDGAGNSTSAKHYQYLDTEVANGTYYYRLLQTDYNGQSHFSDVIVLSRTDEEVHYSIVPNPVQNLLSIHPYDGTELKVSIYDIQGRLVSAMMTESGIIPAHQLIYGVYLIELTGEKSREIIRFVKE